MYCQENVSFRQSTLYSYEVSICYGFCFGLLLSIKLLKYILFVSILSEETVENQTLEYLVSQLHQFFKREDNFKGKVYSQLIQSLDFMFIVKVYLPISIYEHIFKINFQP